MLIADFAADILAVGNSQTAAAVPGYMNRTNIVNTQNRAFCANRRCLHIVHFYEFDPCALRKSLPKGL